MSNEWIKMSLGKVAPADSIPLPPLDTIVWNLSLEDIEGGSGRILDRKYCLVSELGSAKCRFDKSHVLYSKLRPYLNKVVVPDSVGVGTSELIPMRPNPEKLDREFLAFYLRSQEFLDYAVSHTRGANLPRISMQALWSHEIPVPNLSEQQRIVSRIKECMERVDEIRMLQAEASKEADSLFEAFVEAQVEPEWTWQPIFEITTEVRNGWSWKESPTGQPIHVLRLSSVRNLSLDINEVRTVALESKQCEEFSLKKDDVFMVRGNGSKHLVGRSAMSTDNHPTIVFNDLLIRLRFTPEMLPEFANFMLHSRKVREQIERTAKTAAGIWKINQTGIRSLKLPCPPISAQKEKLAALHEGLAISRQIVQHLSQNDTKALSAAILRKAFAGEF